MRIMKWVGSLILAATSLTGLAEAQNFGADGGTIDVANAPMMTNGILTGCQLTFDALIRDFTYRQGAFLGVSGGVAIRNTNQTLGASVKIVANSLDKSGNAIPSPPTRAYLIGDRYTTNLGSLVIAAPSDLAGGLFSVYQIQPTLTIVLDALKSRKLTFAFNQNGGDTDIQLPVELDVISTNANGFQVRNNKSIEDFASCVSALVKD